MLRNVNKCDAMSLKMTLVENSKVKEIKFGIKYIL